MKKIAFFILFLLSASFIAQAQLPNVKLPKVGINTKTNSNSSRENQKLEMQKKNEQTNQQNTYKPKTDEERECEIAKNSLASLREKTEKNLKIYDDAVKNYEATNGVDFISSSDEDYKNDLESYDKLIKTCEKYNCPAVKLDEIKKEQAAHAKRVAEIDSKFKKANENIEKGKNKESDARKSIEILTGAASANPMERTDFMDVNNYKSTVAEFTKLDLKNNMETYKALFADNRECLNFLNSITASDDEAWRNWNDGVFKKLADAYAAKKDNFQIYYTSNAMVAISEEFLKVNPNHAAFKNRIDTYRKYLAESKANISKASASQFHEKNIGNILFSGSEIIAKQENPSSFKSNFTSKDYIYGMIYHPLTKTDAKGEVNLIVYDEKGNKTDVVIEWKDWTIEGHLPIYILVDPYKHGKEFVFTPQYFSSAKGLDKLPYQNNKLRVVLEVDRVPVSEGTISLDMMEGAGIIKEMYEKEEKLKYTFLTPPPVKVKDPAFEAEIMNYYNTKKPAGAKINRVISSNTAWVEYTKDVYVSGKVVTVKDYRSRSFTLIYTSAEGVCLYTFGNAKQNFVNGAFGPTIWDYKSLSKDGGYDFPCQNINR